MDLKGVARPPPFSGRQEDWAEWRFKFLSAMDLLAIGRYMRLAESVERPVTVAEMSDLTRQKSELLHAILVAVCNGKALTLLKLVRGSNGLEVWRILAEEYAPKAVLRYASMLSSLLKPTFHDHAFVEEWLAWEVKISRYEEAGGKPIPDDS